jgi:hypothetical protein
VPRAQRLAGRVQRDGKGEQQDERQEERQEERK